MSLLRARQTNFKTNIIIYCKNTHTRAHPWYQNIYFYVSLKINSSIFIYIFPQKRFSKTPTTSLKLKREVKPTHTHTQTYISRIINKTTWYLLNHSEWQQIQRSAFCWRPTSRTLNTTHSSKWKHSKEKYWI